MTLRHLFCCVIDIYKRHSYDRSILELVQGKEGIIMRLSGLEKKQLWIFAAVAYGVTLLMGGFMWYGYASGMDISAFPNAQMLYPAAGVALLYLVTKKNDEMLPKRFFTVYLILTVLSIFCAVGSVLVDANIMLAAIQLLIVIGSVLCWIFLLSEKKEKRVAYGLKYRNGKLSAICVLLFVLLYILRTVVSSAIYGEMDVLAEVATSPTTWMMLLIIAFNFFLSFIAFFGEEYGWRYYLQPLLQKRYGKRWGVLFVGIVWGLWHLPINIFYYNKPSDGLISVLAQQITCITLGIFFAWAYMKTQNIWVPVVLHFLNNNLIPIISGNYSSDVIQGQEIAWGDLIPALILNGVIFGVFLFSKVFKKSLDTAM